MQTRASLTKTTISLFTILFTLLSLPGIANTETEPKTINPNYFSYIYPVTADKTLVYIDVQVIEDTYKVQQIIDGAIPIPEETLNDPNNSFLKGFLDALKERYPFGKDNPKAFMNIAEDALIVVLGAGITILVTGAIVALASIGASAVGTVLVIVLVAGAGTGLVLSITSAVKKFLKGNKREAGKKTFNLVRESLLLLAGAGIGSRFSGKVSEQSIKLAGSLEKKIPNFTEWLRRGLTPICRKIAFWIKDVPFKVGILARGDRPNALSLFAEKGNFKVDRITHTYKNAQENTLLLKTSEDPELLSLSLNGEKLMELSPKDAQRIISDGEFKLTQSDLLMKNPQGNTILLRKIIEGEPDEYIRIAGGDYREAAFSQVRLFKDGTIKKVFNEIEPGIYTGDPAYEAKMMKIWNEINPNSSATFIEEGTNFIRMTYLDGKPLGNFKVGELRLNPGAWERFVSRIQNFHKHGYIFSDLDGARNIYIVDGEIYLLDFSLARAPDATDIQGELEALETVRQYLTVLGIRNLRLIPVPTTVETEPSMQP